MKYQKIYRKKMLYPGMYVIECPICGRIVASSSERSALPEFSTCDCVKQ